MANDEENEAVSSTFTEASHEPANRCLQSADHATLEMCRALSSPVSAAAHWLRGQFHSTSSPLVENAST